MRLVRLAVLFVVAASPALAQTQTVLYPGMSGSPLLTALRADYTPTSTLGYNGARDALWAYEQAADGELCGVYTRFCIQLTPGADPSSDAYNKGINAEHNWPQSLGAGSEPARGDMVNLFPSRIEANGDRGNHPFAEIPDADTDRWFFEAQTQSAAPSSGLAAWSELDLQNPAPGFSGRFEPRHDHKGNAARSAFYFAAIYASEVSASGGDAFFETMAQDLLDWHYADPVDAREHARGEWIETRQGRTNPFLLDSTLARRAFELSPTDPGDPGDPDAVIWVNEIHYDNGGSDVGEGVEVAGPAGAVLTGWTLVLYSGNDGAAYDTVALSGTLADQQAGFGTAWTSVPGLQNGSPDGLALVDPDGAVVQFLSYEGAFTATDGPADGSTSTDIGVAEDGGTQAGESLQLVGQGAAPGDFAWATPQPDSPGQPNAGQTFTPPVTGGVAWINEFHYDNRRDDVDEGVEVAGTPGLSLDGWTVAYYARTGRVYATTVLSGAIDDEGGLGAVWFGEPELRNAGPGGIALVDATGAVVEFLSYEGIITAVAGPAAGLTSIDVGLEENNSTPLPRTIQRVGRGTVAADFYWFGPRLGSRGSLNGSQTVPPSLASSRMAASVALPDVSLFPNPTAGRVAVTLRLDAPSEVTAEVVDLLGRRVAFITEQGAGDVSLTLDLGAAPAGLYLVRLTMGERVEVRPLTVVR